MRKRALWDEEDEDDDDEVGCVAVTKQLVGIFLTVCLVVALG